MNVSFRASIFMLFSMLCATSGCATAYVNELRHEYRETGRSVGVYGKNDRYPSVYHATWVSACVEVPTWCSPFRERSKMEKDYWKRLCVFGIPMSLVDVPLSIVTDTVMCPYDGFNVLTKNED